MASSKNNTLSKLQDQIRRTISGISLDLTLAATHITVDRFVMTKAQILAQPNASARTLDPELMPSRGL